MQIIKQPKSQPVRVGGSVTLRCEATGYPAPRYQWVKDGAELLDGINEELILDTVTMYDSGNYFCLVSNHVNAEKSDAVDLEVLPSSGILLHVSLNQVNLFLITTPVLLKVTFYSPVVELSCDAERFDTVPKKRTRNVRWCRAVNREANDYKYV